MIDESTFEQCLRGVKRAQKTLYKTYARKMFMHCYRYVKHQQDAEEILSEGFIKVFQNLHKVSYRDAKSFEGWIRRIMVNESLMYLRKKNHLVFDENLTLNIVSNNTADENLATYNIYKTIINLPIGYRTIFNLYAIEGYSHKEIAQKLDIKESTSRSQLSKARKILKTQLSKLDI